MPTFTWFPRARIRYKPLDNSIIEMAEHTIIPTTVHEEDREVASDKRRHSRDMAGGDLDVAPLPRDQILPNYKHDRDSSSTLGASSEPDDVTEEELATLRRVSDKIPMSAWYSSVCVIPLIFFF
jgi:hypothetical protein